ETEDESEEARSSNDTVAVSDAGDYGAAGSVVSAAMAQIGVAQDCTMLVTNALKAVGIYFHSAPAGYFSLGSVVSAAAAQPGDLIYYADGGAGWAHIAVYVGGGQAVHGGWLGQTVLSSVYVGGSAPVFIRLR
ncbi:MAG: NlpC/P60 family protein, partial [Breznakia sp.]